MARAFSSRPRRILFIGDPELIEHRLLPRLAELASLQFEVAATATAGLAAIRAGAMRFDAVMVTMRQTDMEGTLLCARLRERCVQIPVLLLGEDDDEAAIVRGLDSGANDFLAAPLRLPELLARIRAQIRGYETSEEAILTIGPFQFRPASRLLQNCHTNERVRLTEKEAAVLKFLYRAEGPVPRNTLLHEVWGYNDGATTHTVETHIYRLRRKIEPDPSQIALLVNENGGYRLRIGLDDATAGTSQRLAGPNDLTRSKFLQQALHG